MPRRKQILPKKHGNEDDDPTTDCNAGKSIAENEEHEVESTTSTLTDIDLSSVTPQNTEKNCGRSNSPCSSGIDLNSDMAEDLSVGKGVKRRVGVISENKDAACVSSESTCGETTDSILDLSVKKCRTSLSRSPLVSTSRAAAPVVNGAPSPAMSVCSSSTQQQRRLSVTPPATNDVSGAGSLYDSFSPTSSYHQPLLNSTTPSSSSSVATLSAIRRNFAASPIKISKNVESTVSRTPEIACTSKANVTDSAPSLTLAANNSALSDFLNFTAYGQFFAAAAAAAAAAGDNVTPPKTPSGPHVRTLKGTTNVSDVENGPANNARTFNTKLDLASAPSTSSANSTATSNASGLGSLDALSKLSSLVSKVGSNSAASVGLPIYVGSKSTDFHDTLSSSQSGFLTNGKSILASPTGNGHHHRFGAENNSPTASAAASSFNNSTLVKNLLDASNLMHNGGGCANNGAVAVAAAAAAAAGGNVNFQDLWWRFVKREENAEMKRLNEAKQIFTCLQCQASFQTMDQLVKHMEATQHYTNIPKHYSWSLQYARQKMRQMKMKMKYSDKMMYFCFLCQNAFSEPVQVHFNLLHNMHNPAENMKYVQIISSTSGNNINNVQNCAESSGSSSSTSTSSSSKNLSKRNANHGINSKQNLNGRHTTLARNANNHHANNNKDSKKIAKEEEKKAKFSENSLSKLQDIVSK